MACYTRRRLKVGIMTQRCRAFCNQCDNIYLADRQTAELSHAFIGMYNSDDIRKHIYNATTLVFLMENNLNNPIIANKQ